MTGSGSSSASSSTVYRRIDLSTGNAHARVSMNELSIARRYARALYEQGVADGHLEALDADMAFVGRSLDESRELRRMFESPVVPREKKSVVVSQLFEGRVQDVTLGFLRMLVEKNRENIFPLIVQAYRQRRDVELGIIEAHVRVATSMNEEARAAMQRRLEQMTGKKVRLNIEHEPDLIGGAVIRLGDTVFDGSVSNKLALLREQMQQGQFSMN